MALDREAYAALLRGDDARVKRIFLGPELRLFDQMASRAEELARYEARSSTVTEKDFNDSRKESRRALIAVALGAALVIILLLVTAGDIARMALESDRAANDRRHLPDAQPAADGGAAGALRGVAPADPRDAAAGRVRGGVRAVGARRGRRALRLARRTADLHPGRVADPVLRRAVAVAADPAQGLGLVAHARRPGRGHHRARGGRDRPLRVRPRLGSRVARGRGAVAHGPRDPDPAVRALAAEAEGRPDRDRRVGVQRSDRRGARAHFAGVVLTGEQLGRRARRPTSSSTSGSAP